MTGFAKLETSSFQDVELQIEIKFNESSKTLQELLAGAGQSPGQCFLQGWHIPFARAQLGRPHALLSASNDVSDTKSSQGILLLPLISQGRGAEVQDEEEAVQQAPSPEQLEVLIMLSCQKSWGRGEKKSTKKIKHHQSNCQSTAAQKG